MDVYCDECGQPQPEGNATVHMATCSRASTLHAAGPMSLFEYTVAEARERLFGNKAIFRKGQRCPCCDQSVKLYSRRLNSGMAAALVWLVRTSNDGEYLHVPTIAPRHVIRIAGEFARLVYWKLIEDKPNQVTSKTHSGFWRPTEDGIDFVRKYLNVPTHAYIYNGRCRGVSDKTFNVHRALDGGPFDYQELMGEQ